MSDQLESALVIALRDTFAWESALDETTPGIKVSETGTLHPVGVSDPFRPENFQWRDRQLAYRDLIAAAAIVDTSVQITDVWNFAAPKPIMQGLAPSQMHLVVTDQVGNTDSKVRHVANSWVPYDAARYTDLDLYGRDALAYEVLARACEQVFAEPPIERIDPGNTIPNTSNWSLGSGTMAPVDISGGLHLDRQLFGRPDRNLADRDNQVAGYVAHLAQILKNPFAYANRLYVQATGATDPRESEVYILTAEDSTSRTWSIEPALSNGRNQIVYDKSSKTLAWTRERTDELHVPQLYALEVSGIDSGQVLKTVPAVPERKDVQFWRSRAGRVIPYGGSLSDSIVMAFTATGSAVGGQAQVSSASFTVPGAMKITLPGAVSAGNHRIAVLAVPNPIVEIPGIHNISNTTGINGGATYQVDVQSGQLISRGYYVEGGSGIVYNGNTYGAGSAFAAVNTVPTYSQISSGNPSMVRQYIVNWFVALPPGNWALQVEYTNLSGTSSGFGIEVSYQPSNGRAVTIIKDAPKFFSAQNGELVLTHEGQFHPDGTPFTLSIFWTYGTGQLHVRRLIFRNLDIPTCRISMTGTLNVGAASVEVMGKASQPETLLFDVVNNAQSPAVVEFRLNGNVGSDPLLPVQLKQVVIQNMGTYHPTTDSAGFQGWRQECLDRSERILQQTYTEVVVGYGTSFPTLYTSGTDWDWRNSDSWMSLLETRQARLRELVGVGSGLLVPGRQYKVITGPITYEGVSYSAGQVFYATVTGGSIFTGTGQVNQVGAFRKSNPGHIGKPCLIPQGLEFSGSLCSLAWSGSLASPELVACQPWMIDRGLYTAQEEFWMPVSL